MIVLQIVWDVLEDPQSIAEIKSKNPEGYMDEFIAFAKFLSIVVYTFIIGDY